jgi:hypothetical protein
MMPALLGGLFIGVLSALPVVQLCNCCCLWIVCGGMLSAYLEQQNQPVSLRVGQGARVGLIAGLVGAVIWFVIDSALAPLQARFVGELSRNVRDLPPELQDWMEMVESGRAGGNLFGFLVMLVCGSAVSTIGGMIGAAYFRKDVPPALGGPMNPPPLP